MKILFLLPFFKNTGPSNVVVAMLNKLLSSHVKLYLVAFYPFQDNYQTKFSAEQVTMIELNGFNLKSFWYLWKFIRKEKIAVVHSHCLLPDLATPLISLFNGNKKVSTVHCNMKDNYRNEYRFPKGIIYYSLHRLALFFYHQVISVSSSAKISKNTPVIYNGVAERQLNKIPSNDLNLIFAGRLIESKNILFLINCFHYLCQQAQTSATRSATIKLHIFGDGELYQTIQNQHQPTDNGEIIMYGFVDDYLSKIPANSIVVNPSLFEGMPMAVIEALSCHLPVVLSDITAHNEIAQHITNGVVIYNNTLAGFQQAVASLLNDQGQVSFNETLLSQQFNTQFSATVMVEKYLAAYGYQASEQ